LGPFEDVRRPAAVVPNVIYALMPSRLLNLNVMTWMALILGLAWRYSENVWIQALLAVIVVDARRFQCRAATNGSTHAWAPSSAVSARRPVDGLDRLGIVTGGALRQGQSLTRAILRFQSRL
jgi:hypothetical protein